MTTSKQLTRREFARASRLGHGRTLLHVMEHGDGGIEEEIKKCLLKSYAYDVQIEGLRDCWLWQLITLTGRPVFYGEYLLNNFCKSGCERNDVAQQFKLARAFFNIGMSEFRTRMFCAFKENAHMPGMASFGTALVEVAGLTGLEFIAKLVGSSPETLDGYECSRVLERAFDLGYESVIKEHMTELGKTDSRVQAFMNAFTEYESEESISSPSPKPTLAELLAMVERADWQGIGAKFRLLGRRASQEDLVIILNTLKDSQDEQVRLVLLDTFWWRELPFVPSEVLALLQSSNEQIRRRTAKALSQTKSKVIRIKALSLIQSTENTSILLGLEMLESNYQPEDSSLVIRATKSLRDSHDIHSAGMSIRDICKNSADTNLNSLLLWLYERGPDSWCRTSFLEQFLDWKCCPTEILYEAQWDSGEEVRDLARRTLATTELGASRVETTSC